MMKKGGKSCNLLRLAEGGEVGRLAARVSRQVYE